LWRACSIACVVALWCANDAWRAHAASALPTGALAGRVVEADAGGQGVAGTRVIASDPWTGPLDTVRTAADGRFEFARLPAGRVLLDVRRAGYVASGTRSAPVRANDTVRGVRLVIARTATLTGRVLGATGEPLAGAEVNALDAKTRTDADGHYRLTGVRPEPLVVEARTPLRRTARSPLLTLRSGETRSIPDLVLLAGRRVSGRVVGPHGQALRAARVSAEDRDVRTRDDGTFLIGGLSAGGWLSVWKTGYAMESVPLPPDSLDVRDLVVRLGTQTGSGPTLLLSMSRDTWEPTARPIATIWTNRAGVARLSVTRAGRRVHAMTLRTSKSAGGRLRAELPHLPAGEYALAVSFTAQSASRALERSLTFRVSDIALLAEQSALGSRVRAVRLRDGADVAGVPLAYIAPDGSRRSLGATDANGLRDVPGEDGSSVVSGDPRRPATLHFGLRPDAPSDTRLASLTDRPAVRPGGRVGVKVIARTEREGRLAPTADSPVTLNLQVEGEEPLVREGRLDPSGVYVDSLTLPARVTYGAAQLSVTAAGGTTWRTLPLTNRPSPALTVSLTPNTRVALPGDTVRVTIDVRREDGLPASSVTLTVSEREMRSTYDWGTDIAMNPSGALGFTRQVILQTDDRGQATFVEVIPEAIATDADLRISAVAHEGGEDIEGNTEVHALASSRHVSILSAEPAFAGQPLGVTLRVLDLPAETVPRAAVHIDLYKLEYHARVRRAVWVESQDVVTNAQGEATWSSTARPRAGEEYRLRATSFDGAGDGAGRAALAEYRWWTPGQNGGIASEVAFDVTAVRDTVDDTADGARFRVRAGRAGIAHVAVAGRAPLAWLPDVSFVAGTTEIVVPAAEFGAGGVRVAVYASWDGDVFYGEAVTVVRRRDAELSVTVTPDRTTLAPRDSVRLTLTTRDAEGRGVPAEVSLTAYDRALLGFGRDENPNLLEAFWLPRPIPFFVFSSMRRAEAAGGKDERALVRRDIRDVALWLPRLRTGANGTARVTLRVPDNLTTWRLTAHAVGEGTSVGLGTADVVVQRPVALLVSNPEALVAGDSVIFRATLRTASGEPERRFTNWTVRVTGGRYVGHMPDVTVSPQRPAEVELPVAVNANADTLRLVVTAQSGAVGDGVERVVPVQKPWRAVFGGPQGPGVVWDSTVVHRWNAPAVAAVFRSASPGAWIPADPGPERMAHRAARANLHALGLGALVENAEEEKRERMARRIAPGASSIAADVSAAEIGDERDRMFDATSAPRALLRADGSLDVPHASTILLAATAGKDAWSERSLARGRDIARRILQAVHAPRAPEIDRAAARPVLRTLVDRLDADALSAALAESLRAFAGAAIHPPAPDDFETPVDARDLWATADGILLTRDEPAAEDAAVWLALIGDRGRGWPDLWPVVAASHLRPSDVPREVGFLEPEGRGETTVLVAQVAMNEGTMRAETHLGREVLTDKTTTSAERTPSDDLRARLTEPQVLRSPDEVDPPGSLRTMHHRGHAPLSAPADTSAGALVVHLLRDVRTIDAWGEPSTRTEEAKEPYRRGETLRLVVSTTRPVECGDLDAFVPLCGAFDTRPAVGAPGSEARRRWSGDRRMHGRIESPAWRPDVPGGTVWEGTVRVTHAGRFTLLPPALSSDVFPALYRTGEAHTIEVLP
jgi:protocatechuate 3,4-dioxygenase beta subunit